MEIGFTVILLLLFAGLGASVSWLFFRYKNETIHTKLHQAIGAIRNLEKNQFLREQEFRQEQHKNALSHMDAISSVQDEYFKKGFERGMQENTSHIKSQYEDIIRSERDKSANEAREKCRAEYELQSKLFNISIKPYIRISTENSFWKKRHNSKIGYQFQLLVNGIPAFQPHIVIENENLHEEVNDKMIELLINNARKLAESAIQAYIGNSEQSMVLSSQPIIERN